MYSAVATSHRYFPLRASLLILSISPAPPRRRYLTLMKGYLLSKVPMILPTMEPPVRVPYQMTSPSFLAFSREEVGCAVAMLERISTAMSAAIDDRDLLIRMASPFLVE